jgi:hypothetical protein
MADIAISSHNHCLTQIPQFSIYIIRIDDGATDFFSQNRPIPRTQTCHVNAQCAAVRPSRLAGSSYGMAAASQHKLADNKSGKAPTMRSVRAAMLFANRLPGARLFNAWKQRSYPASSSAMLGAFHDFYSDTQKLTSRDTGSTGRLAIR